MRKGNSKKSSKLQMNSNTSNQVNLGFRVWCKGFKNWGVKMWGVELGKRKRVVQGRPPKHKSSISVN
jgi:hypothetical protein